ncbi:hypothetical protein [Mycolicibacterium fortuitum]|uniref:hypothetical protein n=1 Tax=Mycolicibacterium fortuitum TaxID=1766 RepID=UPI0026189DC8|nr:hypothetical protein [Mycolicibacterium fortuitum]
MPHAAPIDSAEFIATDTVMRVVVAHEVVAGPTNIGITLLREEARWWPGDDEPELVDTAVGEIAVSVPPPAEVADVVDAWLIAQHQLRVLPGSWEAKPTEGTDLDLYLAAVAVPAVRVGHEPAAGSAPDGDLLRFKLVENALAPALYELRLVHESLHGADRITALHIATAIHRLIAQLRSAALALTGLVDVAQADAIEYSRLTLPTRFTPQLALPATRRALEQADQILRWSDSEQAAAARQLVTALLSLLVGAGCQDGGRE